MNPLQGKQESPIINESFFRFIFENSPDAFLLLENGVFIDCNQAAVKMLRAKNKQEVLSALPAQLSPPFQADGRPSAEKAEEMIQTAIRNGSHRFEWIHRRMTGEDFPVEVLLTAIKIENRTIIHTAWRDITERKKAEDELKRNVNFTNALLNAIPTPVFYKNREGLYQGCNRAFSEIMGKTAEEIRNKTVYQIWPSEYAELYHQKDLELIQNPQRQVYEATIKDKDGNIRPVIFAKDTFLDESGNVAGLVGAFLDISEIKKAEEELERFKLMVENSTDFINMSDMQGKVLFLNETGRKMVGVEEKDIHTLVIFDLIAEESLQKAQQEALPAILEKGSWSGELRYRNLKTGEIIDVFASTYMIRNPQTGEPQYLVNISHDISAEKQLEIEVEQALERRGYEVEISTEIAQEVAAATELSDLFERVVTLTKERLGYYHTQLLRYDPAQDAVVLVRGYGEIGAKMLASGHKMPMGRGLIGTAAATGKTVMRPVLANDPDWQPNPLLPETKGEIAVPIKWQDQVLGVLDVQSDRAGALTEDDRLLLEGLCGQIAIAMQSAELLKTIRENEARLAEALRTARLAYWEYDVENELFTFNDAFYSLFHTTAEKAGGYKLSSAQYKELFVHPDDWSLVSSEIEKALSSTERVYTTTLDHRVRYEEGGIGYITVKMTVERDENGKISRFYGATQDITERKQAEEALRRSEQLMRTIIDSTPDWIFIKDQEHRYRLANKGYADALHIAPEDFIGKNDLDLGFPEELVKGNPEKGIRGFWADDRLVMDSNQTQVYLDDPATIDGVLHHFYTIKVPLRDDDGKVWGVLAFARDITELKRAEEALRRSEQEMAERLEEISRLYRAMSREGWKTYRETAALPGGFIFDQSGLRPLDGDGMSLASESFVQIPMKVLGGEVVGSLAVADDPQRPLSAEDLEFLEQVSEQVALAMESARLAAQTQLALAETEKLSQASLQLTRAADLQELLKVAVETLAIEKVNRALIGLFDYDAKGEVAALNIAASWWNGTGTQADEVGTRYLAVTVPLVKLFQTPEPLFFNDTLSDPRVDEATQSILQQQKVHALAVLPLFTGERQIGVLILQAEEPYNFSQSEVRLFSALGPQVATVLENRRQFEHAQKQAEREALLNAISQKIQSATSVEAVLQIAARELGHALRAPRAIAQLSLRDS